MSPDTPQPQPGDEALVLLIARALFETWTDGEDIAWEDHDEKYRTDCIAGARAALAVARPLVAKAQREADLGYFAGSGQRTAYTTLALQPLISEEPR